MQVSWQHPLSECVATPTQALQDQTVWDHEQERRLWDQDLSRPSSSRQTARPRLQFSVFHFKGFYNVLLL